MYNKNEPPIPAIYKNTHLSNFLNNKYSTMHLNIKGTENKIHTSSHKITNYINKSPKYLYVNVTLYSKGEVHKTSLVPQKVCNKYSKFCLLKIKLCCCKQYVNKDVSLLPYILSEYIKTNHCLWIGF